MQWGVGCTSLKTLRRLPSRSKSAVIALQRRNWVDLPDIARATSKIGSSEQMQCYFLFVVADLISWFCLFKRRFVQALRH
eukprot:6012500-Amphidinium_carterae.2